MKAANKINQTIGINLTISFFFLVASGVVTPLFADSVQPDNSIEAPVSIPTKLVNPQGASPTRRVGL